MLLVRDPKNRGDFEAVKRSELFRGTDWEAVERRKLQPPFVPPPEELANFDPEFREPIQDKWTQGMAPSIPGFSYTDAQFDSGDEDGLIESSC
jgi:hypothetical protein